MDWASSRSGVALLAGKIVNQPVDQLMLSVGSEIAKCRIPGSIGSYSGSGGLSALQVVNSLAFDGGRMRVWRISLLLGQKSVVPVRKGLVPIVHRPPKSKPGLGAQDELPAPGVP